MQRVLSASKDCYITNKIINNRFRATDANVGQAGTLDLFKLYNESSLATEEKPIENSRILIKFNLDKVKEMHNAGDIDITDSSFKAELVLHDIYGGQTTPSNFNGIVFPLARSFDEGSGFDISEFKDLGATNWITASVTNSVVDDWELPGANKSGSLGESGIDVIVSGTFSGESSARSLSFQQYFETGAEDLRVDVTPFVSASIKDLITNHGFLVALSGSHEKDTNSYFVKRFASRNTANTALRPKMIIKFDDSLNDNHGNFVFDISGSLYLNNFNRSSLENIKSGLAATELTGNECMVLKIQTGSFKKTFKVSQAMRGENRITGVYSASFAISSFESDLYDHILASGSITFDEIWSNSLETEAYLSSSIKISRNERTGLHFRERRLLATTLNLNDSYRISDLARIRLFIENADRSVVFTKGPIDKPSEIFDNVHFSVKDFVSGEVIVPFDTENNSTKLSTDSQGMYYDFYMSSLPRGRTYIFEYLVIQNGVNTYIDDAASKFTVE